MGSEMDKSPWSHERTWLVEEREYQREAKINALLTLFNSHGDRVVAMVREALGRDGDLRRLVHDVTGRVANGDERRCEALLDFIARHGEEVFVRQAMGSREPDRPNTRTQSAQAQDQGEAKGKEEDAESARPGEAGATPSGPAAWNGRWVRLTNGKVIRDRRSGNDRRSGKDRRQRVESIRNNRRFGGDRRKCQRRQAPPQCVDPVERPKRD
jgi:hypothetical protein